MSLRNYYVNNNLRSADIWMWVFDKDSKNLCITDAISDSIQRDLDEC